MRLYTLLITALLCLSPLANADVELRVSIKVILGPNGERPSQPGVAYPNGVGAVNLNSEQAIRDNIAFANRILAGHAVGYRLILRENKIYTLSGLSSPWFTKDARSETTKNEIEAAATKDATSIAQWQWHGDSINIYINNSRSGVCSGPANGGTIVVGAGAYQELILHEIGHFFNLAHTHTSDGNGKLNDWADGDTLEDTLPDDADATEADIRAHYKAYSPTYATEERLDDLIHNIMSYHKDLDCFTWSQRELFVEAFNGSRKNVATGRARFVGLYGNDSAQGQTFGTRLLTIGRAVGLSSTSNDVVLILGNIYNDRPRIYSANAQGLPLTLSKPVTLSAWRGPVTINR